MPHACVIDWSDKGQVKNYLDCMWAMISELRACNQEVVHKILDSFEAKYVDYGMGYNLDWPERYKCPECKKVSGVVIGPDQSDPFDQVCIGSCRCAEKFKSWIIWRSS